MKADQEPAPQTCFKRKRYLHCLSAAWSLVELEKLVEFQEGPEQPCGFNELPAKLSCNIFRPIATIRFQSRCRLMSARTITTLAFAIQLVTSIDKKLYQIR